ncbi:type I restriction enzyme HsdR N-terminal domain-containing protein [Stigmatella aurantiaca]|uniref:Restriction endonuclease-like protein n=1 Tax=Stigmatella aurantiaca (strain DW4/3-1) TaxID=378806 RepID=Q099A7_STIAD|nr:type I restriction enzyme HsdR N-terminal domain-containing protein [Stigmatella aurantiaca]ADO75436.1 restriction endonuclease-like protein [Stigmatella aurantiaca DW4/3-1]EAU68280.1 type I restriction enzyme r protein n terminus (hsdr_n) [Stigmatella aurantiaca DW4/3-1]
MEANQLLDLVKRFNDNREYITNEETAKMALVVPFIRLLGYDPNIPKEVRLEYAAEFTQGDGKRLPDRMDFAIFDQSGSKPLMVIETKPLGTDLMAKSQQLARYIAQMAELHFGIITDGCHYLFFGDLENPNQMDSEPFFSFSLEDTKTDWSKVAKFLSKFSRDSFNAETLVTDAENSRYRQAMIDRLAAALKAPAENEGFMRWLTEEVYKGKRTGAVMTRLGEVAKEAIEPALLRVMGDDFLDKLKERIQRLRETGDSPAEPAQNVLKPDSAKPFEDVKGSAGEEKQRQAVETTQEELDFFALIRDICAKGGMNPEEILYRDTTAYFNISYRKPTKWFLRFFSNNPKRKSVVTWVPTAEAKQLVSGFVIEDAPAALGLSRIYLENIAQIWALKALVLRSLELSKASKEEVPSEVPALPAPPLKEAPQA